MVHHGLPHALCSSIERMSAVAQLLTQADHVARVLQSAPQTLLHGDYWPGNIIIDEDEHHLAYDWQAISVGPGILDLVNFVNKSRMHYDSLPVDMTELVWLYRYTLATLGHNLWDEAEWQRLWDYALMWRFLQEQLSSWEVGPHQTASNEQDAILEKIWLNPMNEAVNRQLQKYALV
jgi:aminoglycoside phosphotransferase (APT) family kinase protein